MLRQFFSVFALLLFACNGESQNQNTKVGGPCEGCEAIYEYGNKVLNSINTYKQYNTLCLSNK